MLPYLTFILFAPLAGALLILVIPREDVRTIRIVGVVFALVALALAVVIWVQVAPHPATMQLTEDHPWIKAFKVNYHLGADGLSAPLVTLAALATLLALFYSTRTVEVRVKEYFALFLLLETSAFGVFLALDLVLFYVFWVVGLLPLLLLISVWGGEDRERAAIKAFLYNLLGSVLLLLAILGVYSATGTFDIAGAAAARPYAGQLVAAGMAFWALFVAFAIRLPSFPFHTWLADAQTEAPTAASAVLASLFLGTGGYGLIRIALPLFPGRFDYFVRTVWIIPVLAVLSIVYGALVCMAQWNIKRLFSTLALAQMGFVTLGVCAAAVSYTENADAAASGLSGAAMQLFAHGAISAVLFFLAGILYERTHTYDLKAFGGLANQVPHYYGLMLAAGFAALGLPGLIGFWGELFVFKGAVAADATRVFAFIGVLGVLFTAGCVLWKIVQHLFLGTLDQEKWGQLPDMTGWERLTVWPLVIVMVVLGFYPALALDMFNGALTTLLNGLK